MFTIYEIRNSVTGDSYVGLTSVGCIRRWARHRTNAKAGANNHFARAIRKYGADKFIVVDVASVLEDAYAGDVERSVIQSFKPKYNSTNGGEVTAGRHISPEANAARAKKNTGLKRSPEVCAAISVAKRAQYANGSEAFKKNSAEHLRRVRGMVDEKKRIKAVADSARGRVWSVESRARAAESKWGNVPSVESKLKNSLAHNKAVICTTLNTTFNSISNAAAATGLSISGVSRVCCGERNSANGMRFSFI